MTADVEWFETLGASLGLVYSKPVRGSSMQCVKTNRNGPAGASRPGSWASELESVN